MMQTGSITCTSQRFALTRCHCSSQEKKPRHRRSKEERRVMVETFVTNFRNTNNGNFPSLKLTHKEVGGSYYIVRDIMRDIIQENRVLGPGDLDMQSLTLEDAPVQPEICENVNTITSAELHLEASNEGDYIVVETVNQGSNVSIESLENHLVENGNQNLHSSNGKNFEKIEVSNYKEDDRNFIAEENYIHDADDVAESDFHKNEDVQGSLVNIVTEIMDESANDTKVGEVKEVSESDDPSPYTEAIKVDSFMKPGETNESTEGFERSMVVENVDIQDSVIDVSKKTVTESKCETGKLKGDVLESADTLSASQSGKVESSEDLDVTKGDLKEVSAETVNAETIGKSNSVTKKDERCQSSESNGKMPLDENKKSTSLIEMIETRGSNEDLEMGRTVVEVEQFPLPRANNSLNSEDPGCVSSSAGIEDREMEFGEVKAPAALITKTEEAKAELENLSPGKIPDTVSDTEHGAALNDTTKAKRRELTPITPINEYLLHRHESYLKLDFLTPEISMDASSNREGVKQSRAKAENNNPFWNTFRAFVTAFIKFWTE